MSGGQIAFLALALLTVLGSVGVVFLRRPVHAALSLVLCFFVLGFMYMTLGSQLLGITQIMVYAGAIMVLFLFVVMMLKQVDQKGGIIEADLKLSGGVIAAIVMGAGIYSSVLLPLNNIHHRTPEVQVASNREPIPKDEEVLGTALTKPGLKATQPSIPYGSIGSPGAIGYSLFADYIWPFEMVSVLLLVGIVGSIMLAKRKF
ncbi:MAG: NADH-quinone oxidoreductase subunit J [Armatimonadota bacterium]